MSNKKNYIYKLEIDNVVYIGIDSLQHKAKSKALDAAMVSALKTLKASPDAFGVFGGKPCLVDFKTTKLDEKHSH